MWIALACSVILGALGQIFMKEGMKMAGPVPLSSPPTEIFQYALSAVFSIRLVIAAICYGLSFVLWLGVLSVADLTLTRPLMSAGYILTLIYGFFSGEDVTMERVLGTFLIVAGTIFMVRSAH